jgi:NADH-quinone oxidoreductase subunit F
MMEFLQTHGNGIKGGALKAVIPGGSSCPVLTAEECGDLTLTYESMLSHGTMFGTGCVTVLNEHTDMVRVLENLTRFYSRESCGQCTPCREGTAWADRLMRKILSGEGTARDLDLILEVADNMDGKTICTLAMACAMPVRSFIHKFRADFEKHCKPSISAVPAEIS